MKQQNREFEQRVKTTLESSVANLDIETRTRLAKSRARALGYKPWFKRWLPSGNWVTATAFAAVIVLVVTLSFALRRQDTPSAQIAQVDPDIALEILLGDAQQADCDPDFYIAMDAMMNDEDKKNAG